MSQTNKPTGLIRPFNLDPQEYDAMYHAKPPEGLTLTLVLDTRQGRCPECGDRQGMGGLDDYWDNSDPEAVLTDLVKSCIANTPYRDIKPNILLWAEEEDMEYSIVSALPLSQPQEEWLFDGMVHAQVGFHSFVPHAILRPEPSMYMAMSIYDALYVGTGSLDPKDHRPLDVSEWQERVFRLAVGDSYGLTICNWCEALSSLRNEVMVKVRATMLDDDPDTEWKRYSDAGLVHFLDLLKI